MPGKTPTNKKGGKKGKEEEIKIPKDLIEQFQPDQFALSQQIFTAYDKGGSGIIDTKDLGLMLRLIGGNPTDKEIEEWTEAVKNQDGKMNILGFLQAAAFELRTRKSDADIIVAFSTFDREQDGFVRADEVRKQLVANGEAFPENVADEFITEATAQMDESGRIDYRAFIAAMKVDSDKAWKKKAKKLGIGQDDGKGGKGKKGAKSGKKKK